MYGRGGAFRRVDLAPSVRIAKFLTEHASVNEPRSLRRSRNCRSRLWHEKTMWLRHFWCVAIVAAADRSSIDRARSSHARHPQLLNRRAATDQPIIESTSLYAAGEPIDLDPELECKKPDGIAVFEVPFVFVVQAAAIMIACVIALQTIVPLEGLPDMVQKVCAIRLFFFAPPHPSPSLFHVRTLADGI